MLVWWRALAGLRLQMAEMSVPISHDTIISNVTTLWGGGGGGDPPCPPPRGPGPELLCCTKTIGTKHVSRTAGSYVRGTR